MKILLAIFADEVIDQDDEQYDIVGARHSIQSEHFPVSRRIQLIVQVRPELKDKLRLPLLKLVVPDINYIGETSVILPLREILNGDEDELPGKLMLKIPLVDITFAAAGIYEFKLLLDGSTAFTIPLEAKRI
jgi:hypothetical protein